MDAAQSPVRTSIRSASPLLRWHAIPRAVQYTIAILDAKDHLINESTITYQTPPVPGSILQIAIPPLSDETKKLIPGEIYQWQVDTKVDGISYISYPAIFRILPPTEVAKVSVAEPNFKATPLDLATLYEMYGLYEEALAPIEQFASEHPEDHRVQRILQHLRQQLGRQ